MKKAILNQNTERKPQIQNLLILKASEKNNKYRNKNVLQFTYSFS